MQPDREKPVPRYAPGDEHDRVRSMRLRKGRAPSWLGVAAWWLFIAAGLFVFVRYFALEHIAPNKAQPKASLPASAPAPSPLPTPSPPGRVVRPSGDAERSR